MFSSHERMLRITRQPHVCKLKSMSLIRSKAKRQKYDGDILQHEVYYINPTQLSRMTYCDPSKRPAAQYNNVVATNNKQELRASNYSEQLTDAIALGETEVLGTLKLTEEEITVQSAVTLKSSPVNDNESIESDTCATSYTQSTQSSHEPQATCALLGGHLNYSNGQQDAVFTLHINNLSIRDELFTQKTLQAIQVFVDEGYEKIQRHENPIANILPHILTRQYIHTMAATNMPESAINKSLTLKLQIQGDGKLQYISAESNKNTHEGGYVFICKQNYILDTWIGHIQHIDYQCLYNSLDTLFTYVYADTDIQIALSRSPRILQRFYSIFHNMHFPAHASNTLSNRYTEIGKEIVAHIPIATAICNDSNAQNTTVITELAHMSVLIDIHRQLVDIGETFAHELTRELSTDILGLWTFRELIMPKASEYDAFKYGIVPVVQDILPYDYDKYTGVLMIPQYMRGKICSKKSLNEYMGRMLIDGTYEMYTWGYALVCLHAATRLSLVESKAQAYIMSKLESIMQQVDERFTHFLGTKMNICAQMMELHIHEISGGAMPLFCMAICSVMSLSQALHNIADPISLRNNRVELDYNQLIRINLKIYEDIVEQQFV